MYGKDYGYAQTRIQGTILRIQKSGEPVYVASVSNDGTCVVIPIEHSHLTMDHAVRVGVDDLDMHPVSLGYVNVAGEATYLMRIPMRRDWKQGLRSENCYSSGRRLSQMPMKAVRSCIMNKYPTFKKVCTDIEAAVKNNRVKTLAWHRNWALRSDTTVFYKNLRVVGRLVGGAVVLDKGNEHLKECLEESM